MAAHPVALWAAGLLFLTCILFCFARRKYLRKKQNLLSVLDEEDVKWQKRAVLSSELLEKFERKAGELLAEHRRLDAHLAEQRKNLQGLIAEASKTMERLKGLIETFEKVYYDDSSESHSISGVFKDLQNDFLAKMVEFNSVIPDKADTNLSHMGVDEMGQGDGQDLYRVEADETDDLFGSFDSILDELGLDGLQSGHTGAVLSKDATAAESSEANESNRSGSCESNGIDSLPVETEASASDSTLGRSRQVRKLHGQGKSVEEIAAELEMKPADVELIVRILDQNRRVA